MIEKLARTCPNDAAGRRDASTPKRSATGLSKMILETLIEQQPTQLIYVSCNPATLARDLAALKKSFRIDSITPLNMFPQTTEVEVVVDFHP